MSEEIKEILDDIKIVSNGECARVCFDDEQCDLLLNYITNLQKENKQLKKSRDFHLRFNQSLMRRVDFYQSRNEKAVELLKRIQEKYGYMLEDVIFLLLQDGDE